MGLSESWNCPKGSFTKSRVSHAGNEDVQEGRPFRTVQDLNVIPSEGDQ